MDNEQNQELVIKILKILNTHHSDLIQRTVNKCESSFNMTTELDSTIDFNFEKENFQEPQPQKAQTQPIKKVTMKEPRVSSGRPSEIENSRRRSSLEKNVENLQSYKSNLEKVDRILYENSIHQSVKSVSTRPKSKYNSRSSVSFAHNTSKDRLINRKGSVQTANEQVNYNKSETKLTELISKAKYGNSRNNKIDISLNKNEYTSFDYQGNVYSHTTKNQPPKNIFGKNPESGYDSICKHLNGKHLINFDPYTDETATEDEFYSNEEFEYDAAAHELDFDESQTPSTLISRQPSCTTRQIHGIKVKNIKL